ncbi:ORF6N domain-containing protein [Candidatus Weimeria sp. HCP3S3_B5]|uniref:ORF6N domain-containing protein n=1 Tax=Candidatus Weimeria sp. HCP3S3_B5 TaxID=3438871 RepID=UPI003F8C63B8
MANQNNKTEIIPVYIKPEDIENLVYTIRGKQVMLDHDLALIYGYEVKRLNEQVKRNINRFPEDFMFQLTKEEIEFVKSQIVTSRNTNFYSGQDGGRRKPPYAFTEQGIYMLATVLKGELAEQQSIFIMRAFREMRHYIRQNQQFVTKNELQYITDTLTETTKRIERRQDDADAKMSDLQESINKINENFVLDTELKNYVIYKGQKFEADVAYIKIYQMAKKSIYVIDDYVNIKTLHQLSQKKNGVSVILFTENGHGRRGFLTSSDVTDFQAQYPSLIIKPNPDCHDRFIVLDYGLKTEKVFHCGASSKDAGRKVCAINTIENTAMLHPVIDALLLLPDKVI